MIELCLTQLYLIELYLIELYFTNLNRQARGAPSGLPANTAGRWSWMIVVADFLAGPGVAVRVARHYEKHRRQPEPPACPAAGG